jgi:ribose transport system ATP-binding protein
MSGELLLEARDIAKRFGSVVALRGASLAVRGGEVHALMGANGAGKSTLVKLLTGAIRPDTGAIVLGGAPRQFRSPAEARRAGIVSVYQDPALVPDLTIGQNLRLADVPAAATREWMARFGFARLDFGETLRDLPLPLQRLIDLARALAAQPNVLVLDEVTATLPADLTERVFDVVAHWRQRGRAVIFISHRLAEVSALCDRATVLRDGVTVGVVEPARGSEERIVALMLGEVSTAPTAAARSAAAVTGEPELEVEHLQRAPLLADVSFALRAGEVLGVAALEGQGQSELFDCLAGLRRPDAGAIRVRGRPRVFHHPADAIRDGVVLVPADRLQGLLPQRSIRENVVLPLARRLLSWGPVRLDAERRRVAEAVRRMQIDTRAGAEVRQLSGGNQQKVVVARWLACGFRTLLLFDPTRGIDIGTKQQFYALIRQLADAGAAVLLFTSELTEIELVCDRVIVLFGGRVVNEMPAATADEAHLLRAAHGLARVIEPT